MSAKHYGVLMLKILSDCISRITFFSVFMYVTYNGQFSTWYVTISYYVMMVIMVVFNLVLNKKDFSVAYVIGKEIYSIKHISLNYLIFDFYQNSFWFHWVVSWLTITLTYQPCCMIKRKKLMPKKKILKWENCITNLPFTSKWSTLGYS